MQIPILTDSRKMLYNTPLLQKQVQRPSFYFASELQTSTCKQTVYKAGKKGSGDAGETATGAFRSAAACHPGEVASPPPRLAAPALQELCWCRQNPFTAIPCSWALPAGSPERTERAAESVAG